MRKTIGIVLLLTIMCGCNRIITLRTEFGIERIRTELNNVGLAVAVVQHDEIVYSHAFGVRNAESGEPLQLDDMFRIASISKSFTTVSLLQLVEQGKVSLCDDVSCLAGFDLRNPRYPDTPITLEMLLSHTSSLNDSEGYFDFDIISDPHNPLRVNCFNDYEPGRGYEYCNLNLNLAGSFLEKLSGERFDMYVIRHILQPLGLEGGYHVDSLDRSRLVSLYSITGTGELICRDEEAYESRSERIRNYRMGYDTPLFSPTGGMKLSALSLARYMIMHINYGVGAGGVRIISEESEREMQRPRSADENYGLSLWQTDLYSPEVTLVGHTGGAYGMRSAMFFNSEKHYGFVVISNGAQGDEAILTRTLKLLYKLWGEC